MGNGIGPLMNLQNQPSASGQPNQPSDPNQEKVKQLLSQMMQMAARTGAGGTSNVGMAKPPAPRPSTNVQFGGAAAGIMGIIESIKGRKNAIEAQKAESYYSQISSFLQPTGDPNTDAQNRQKAELFLSDPKIQKTLEKGLGYFQLMEPEEPPAEAIGIHKAMQKDKSKQSQGRPQQRQRPALPQGGPMGNQEQMLKILKGVTDVQGTMAGTKEKEVSTQQTQQQIDMYKQITQTNLNNIKASTDNLQWELSNKKDMAPLEKQQKEKEVAYLTSQAKEADKRAKLYDADAYYNKNIKPQAYAATNFKTAYQGLVQSERDAATTMNTAREEWSKYQGWQDSYDKAESGVQAKLLKQFNFDRKEDLSDKVKQSKAVLDQQIANYKKIAEARQKFSSQQTQIMGNQIPVGVAIANAYQSFNGTIPDEVVNGIASDIPDMNSSDIYFDEQGNIVNAPSGKK